MDGWIFPEIKLECVQNFPEIKLECVQKVCRGGGVNDIKFGCYRSVLVSLTLLDFVLGAKNR